MAGENHPAGLHSARPIAFSSWTGLGLTASHPTSPPASPTPPDTPENKRGNRYKLTCSQAPYDNPASQDLIPSPAQSSFYYRPDPRPVIVERAA